MLTAAVVAVSAGCGSVDLTMNGRNNSTQGGQQTAVSVVKPIQTTVETTTAVTTEAPEPEPV